MSQCAQSFPWQLWTSISAALADHFSHSLPVTVNYGFLFWCPLWFHINWLMMLSKSSWSECYCYCYFDRAAFLIITGFVLTHCTAINTVTLYFSFLLGAHCVCSRICKSPCDCSPDVLWEHRLAVQFTWWILGATNWRHTLSSPFFLLKKLPIPGKDESKRVKQVIGTTTSTVLELH